VIDVDQILAVVRCAERGAGDAGAEHRDHELVERPPVGVRHAVDLVSVEPELIVEDVVLRDLERRFVREGHDRVGFAAELVQMLIADPAAHLRNVAQPDLSIDQLVGLHDRREPLVDRRGPSRAGC
jgi:hypothetical protein